MPRNQNSWIMVKITLISFNENDTNIQFIVLE